MTTDTAVLEAPTNIQEGNTPDDEQFVAMTPAEKSRERRRIRMLNAELSSHPANKVGSKAEIIAKKYLSGEISQSAAEAVLSEHIKTCLLAYIPGFGEEAVGNAIRNTLTSVNNHKFLWSSPGGADAWLGTILRHEHTSVGIMKDRWPKHARMVSLNSAQEDLGDFITPSKDYLDLCLQSERVSDVMDQYVPDHRRVARQEQWDALQAGFFPHLPSSDSLKSIRAKHATQVRRLVHEGPGDFYSALRNFVLYNESSNDQKAFALTEEALSFDYERLFEHFGELTTEEKIALAKSLVSLGSKTCDAAYDCSLTSAYQRTKSAHTRRNKAAEAK